MFEEILQKNVSILSKSSNKRIIKRNTWCPSRTQLTGIQPKEKLHFDSRTAIYVTFASTTTRSSSSGKLVHNICHSNRDKYFYFNRLPRLWNSLPIIDLSQGTKSLKRKLKEYFWNHFLTSFDPENPCTFHLICPCSKCAVLPVSNNYSMAL